MTPPRTVTVGRVELDCVNDICYARGGFHVSLIRGSELEDGEKPYWLALMNGVIPVRGDTAQHAADALTAKLVALRAAIDGVLGDDAAAKRGAK